MTGDRPVDAVVFDLDGVLIDSEHLWEEAWTAYCTAAGYRWTAADTAAAQGMSTLEWSAYIARVVDRPDQAPAIVDYCVTVLLRRIVADGEGAPLPGARELVTEVSRLVPVALASSAARRVIDAVLVHHGLADLFAATVSSEEVAQGKPSPDVYLEAARRLGLQPGRCVAVEDSTNGILAAVAAGLAVVAIPNTQYPPGREATAAADHVAADPAGALAYLTSLIAERSAR